MGFFDFLFGPKSKSSPSSSQAENNGGRFRYTKSVELHQDLYHALKTILSGEQREKVEEIVRRYMGGGGVTHGEIDTWIIRDLRKLRDSGGMSRIEFEAVMRLLSEHSQQV